MKEFEGVKIPDQEPTAEGSSLLDKQYWYCRKVDGWCDDLKSCNECLFGEHNLDKFHKWYEQQKDL